MQIPATCIRPSRCARLQCVFLRFCVVPALPATPLRWVRLLLLSKCTPAHSDRALNLFCGFHTPDWNKFSHRNCGDPNHLLDRCPKPRDLTSIANRRYLRYNREYSVDQPRVLRRILYEITSQFPTGEGLAITDNDTEESDTEDHFEQSEEYSTLFCIYETSSDEAP